MSEISLLCFTFNLKYETVNVIPEKLRMSNTCKQSHLFSWLMAVRHLTTRGCNTPPILLTAWSVQKKATIQSYGFTFKDKINVLFAVVTKIYKSNLKCKKVKQNTKLCVYVCVKLSTPHNSSQT